ncbi:MAG: altronate dehydratase, partial [Planctomycetaceae bacterium]
MSPSENPSSQPVPHSFPGGQSRPSVPPVILLSANDHVAIAVRPLEVGQEFRIGATLVRVIDPIPAGHKVAIRGICEREAVFKYGQPIGRATIPIAVGCHVHSHNLGDDHQSLSVAIATSPPPPPKPLKRTFEGFVRPDGRVGTRN